MELASAAGPDQAAEVEVVSAVEAVVAGGEGGLSWGLELGHVTIALVTQKLCRVPGRCSLHG